MTAVGYHLTDEVGTAGLAGRLVGLSPAAISCLHVMAHTALDRPSKTEPGRTYFAGWDRLAFIALGRVQYDRAAEQAVTRAVRELVAAGLIKPVGRRNGMRQGTTMYELLL